MRRVFFVMTIVFLVCGMYSCKQANTAAKSGAAGVNSELTNKYWKLVELMGEPVVYPEGYPKEAYISFKSDGSVSGNSGCNTFHGKYVLENVDRIRFSQMVSTQMMCIDMSIETKLLQVLNTADSYYSKGDTFVLNRARMAPLARFEAVYM